MHLYAHRTSTSTLVHLLFASSSRFLRCPRIILLAILACPLVLRCSIDVILCLIPRSLKKPLSFWFVNYRPLSVTNVFRIPKCVMIFFQKNFWTTWAVIFASGSASIYFVKESTVTSKNFLYPGALGKGLRLSIPQTTNNQGKTIACNSSANRCIKFPCFWHWRHFFTNLEQSVLKVGQ